MSIRAKRVASDPKVAVLEQILQAANRHDAGTIAKYFAEDGVYENIPLGTRSDRNSQRQFHDTLFRSFPDLQYQLNKVLISEDHLIAEGRVKGTNQGAFFGRPPTGRAINLPVAFIIEFAGGKIKHWKSYYDSGTMFKQMGT